MADTFGLRIGVEGEKEFKNALRDINRSFKVLGSEMELVSAQFGKNDKSVEALTSRKEVLGREIDEQRKKTDVLRAALENAAASFGENDKRTQEWQIQLNRANAALIGMERELGDTNNALEEAAKETNDLETQTEQLGDELDKTGKDAAEAGSKFERMRGTLKSVGLAMGTAFVAVGVAAAAAGRALAGMSVGAATYADEILTAATVTGMGTDALQAYRYAAELVDVPLETLTGSMAKNIRAMDNARRGVALQVEAYDALGVSVTDAGGNLRDAETVYWETIDALGRINDETERSALSMRIFGKSALELNPLIAQGSAGIAELTEEARQMGAVMSEEALSSLGAFDDTVQRLTAGAGAARNALGMVLLPQLTVLGTQGVELLGNFTRGLNEAGGEWTRISAVVGDAVGGIVDTIMKTLPDIIQLGMDIVMSIGRAITDNLSLLADAAAKIIMTLLEGLIKALPGLTEGALRLVLALADGIVAALPALVEAAAKMIATLAGGIGDALPRLIPALVQAVVLIARTLVENLPLLLEASFQLIIGLARGLLGAIPQLVSALPAIITAVVDFLIAAIPQIIEAGILLIVALVAALPEIIPAVVAAIPQIIAALVGAILGSTPQLIQAGVQLFTALVRNLPFIIAEIVKAAPQIVSGLVKAFSGSAYRMAQVGGGLIRGLWQGISNMGAWLRAQIAGFMNGIVGGIKSFFGIRSPSVLFAGIGGDMAAGIGVGFERAMSRVGDDMRAAVPTGFALPGAADRDVKHIHSGVITIKGVTNEGEFVSAVDAVMAEMRRSNRR
ncbi:MAG: phage tail protein [Firmicutes bacterium]|nr:phage tail protein [Bacillota bacterium]